MSTTSGVDKHPDAAGSSPSDPPRAIATSPQDEHIPNTFKNPSRLLLYFFLAIAFLHFLTLTWLQSKSNPLVASVLPFLSLTRIKPLINKPTLHYPDGSLHPNPPSPDHYLPIQRASVLHNHVACWPRDHGVWIKTLTPVEMKYLNTSRFTSTPANWADPEETTFCGRLRRLGADFYEHPIYWNFQCSEKDFCAEPILKVGMELCFVDDDQSPQHGSGVWFLDIRDGWEAYGEGAQNMLGRALTMQERCQIIETLGGKFCESMQACEETVRLVKEPVLERLPSPKPFPPVPFTCQTPGMPKETSSGELRATKNVARV